MLVGCRRMERQLFFWRQGLYVRRKVGKGVRLIGATNEAWWPLEEGSCSSIGHWSKGTLNDKEKGHTMVVGTVHPKK